MINLCCSLCLMTNGNFLQHGCLEVQGADSRQEGEKNNWPHSSWLILQSLLLWFNYFEQSVMPNITRHIFQIPSDLWPFIWSHNKVLCLLGHVTLLSNQQHDYFLYVLISCQNLSYQRNSSALTPANTLNMSRLRSQWSLQIQFLQRECNKIGNLTDSSIRTDIYKFPVIATDKAWCIY